MYLLYLIYFSYFFFFFLVSGPSIYCEASWDFLFCLTGDIVEKISSSDFYSVYTRNSAELH